MEEYMMVIGIKEKYMEKVFILGRMEIDMKGSIIWRKGKGKEYLYGIMERCMMESG